MEVLVGIDPITGLNMYRELDFFIGGVIEPKITVQYRQWLLSPNKTRLNELNQRKYFIVDIPAITRKGDPLLISPEIDDSNGNIIPAVYNYDVPDVIITESNLGYTMWNEMAITSEMNGLKLGKDLIIGAINKKLASLPTDVADGYIIQTSK